MGNARTHAPRGSRSFAGRHKLALVLAGLGLAVVLLAAACLAILTPAANLGSEIVRDSEGRLTWVNYSWVNGREASPSRPARGSTERAARR